MSPYIPSANGGNNYYFSVSLMDYDGVPIVFLATDDQDVIYLCECTDTRFGEQDWTIARTDYDTIEQLISRRITMYDALRSGSGLVTLASLNEKTGTYSQQSASFDTLGSENLPDPNAKIWLTSTNVIASVRRLFFEKSQSSALGVDGSPSFVFKRMNAQSFVPNHLLGKVQTSESMSLSLPNGYQYGRNEVEAA